ncbi:MAG: acetate/propionate family kinase [Nitrospirales bacterium]
MRVLTINSGSSSVKFSVKEGMAPTSQESHTAWTTIIRGTLSGIGSLAAIHITRDIHPVFTAQREVDDHQEAFAWLFESLATNTADHDLDSDISNIDAIGHRIVHGGDQLSESTFINDHVLREIELANELAPLHNHACLAGISGVQAWLKKVVPMVAVFDTTFHRTLPDYAASYAIPHTLAERHHIKRYGFHGVAHASLAQSYASSTGSKLSHQRLITMQLGHGCSMTANAYGQSIDTSMGFTPCEGLMMGTRSGDLDPAIVSYLTKKEQVSARGVQSWLNEHSGLLGISGRTSDMRQLLDAMTQQQDSPAKLAVDMFCYRIRKYLGAYLAVLGGADAIVFGGGIGENAPEIRSNICQEMKWCGIHLDPKRNQTAVGLQPGEAIRINTDDSQIAAYVIGTDEESWIASETARCLHTRSDKERPKP